MATHKDLLDQGNHLEEHLEQEALDGGGNRRHGTSSKTVLTGTSKLTISVPQVRVSSLERKLIARVRSHRAFS